MKKFLILIGFFFVSCSDKDIETTYLKGVVTTSVTNITATSATCEGYVVIPDTDVTIIKVGICYALTKRPTIEMDVEPGDRKDIKWTANLSHLQANKTYYARAYVEVEVGGIPKLLYGNEINFDTLKESAGFESIVTTSVTNITATSATCEGYVVTPNTDVTIIEVGFCYALTELPVIEEDNVEPGEINNGKWIANLPHLQSDATYYVRAYIRMQVGERDSLFYGNEISFHAPKEAPSFRADVQFLKITHITDMSAICTGLVLLLQGSVNDIEESGICYLVIDDPTEEDCEQSRKAPTEKDFEHSTKVPAKKEDKVGKYSVKLLGIESGTTYYVRAYTKTHSSGFFYSENQRWFKTDTLMVK